MSKREPTLPAHSQRDKEPFIWRIKSARSCALNWIALPALVVFVLLSLVSPSLSWFPSLSRSPSARFSDPIPSCKDILSAPSLASYLRRQRRLAHTLLSLDASAYIVEPSPSALYFFNVSSLDWHLSERPFLLALVPLPGSSIASAEDGEADFEVFVVTPSFEKTRAQTQLHLALPEDDSVTWLPWEEAQDPFEALAAHAGAKIYLDHDMRVGMFGDLQTSFERVVGSGKVEVLPAAREIRAIRERKDQEELDLLRCANELTLHAIKATRARLSFGVTEAGAHALLSQEFARVGMQADGIILFGPNAALPHGASSARKLRKDDLVLIDAGGQFKGYIADVTRTFALDRSQISDEHLAIWHLVKKAQRAAYEAVVPGARASQVDDAAREVIEAAGHGRRFTHRLGHGIGLEVHEPPYLNAGAKDTLLAVGNSFSCEPGVYIEGEVGVRLEDCWHVGQDGKANLFTGQATSPWEL